MYVGSLSHEPNKTRVESAKLILSIGALKSDFNTGNFTYRIPQSHTIELHSTHTQIRYAMYPGIGMKPLLPKLTVRLAEWRSVAETIMVTPFASMTQEEVVTAPSAEGGGGEAQAAKSEELLLAEGEVIHHDWFWPRIGKFLQRGDVVVSETGTSSFGVLDVVFPDEATLVTQILWGSIGWTVGGLCSPLYE
jgi:pyruvate decarboxylase